MEPDMQLGWFWLMDLLPDFVEISQIGIVGSDLNFIVKLFNSWYYEHFRGFVLEHSGRVTLLHIQHLSDTYHLAAYCVGGKCMVSLKRHTFPVLGGKAKSINCICFYTDGPCCCEGHYRSS